ncbi:hypothetical protein D3C85_1540330 [compost metagenome]
MFVDKISRFRPFREWRVGHVMREYREKARLFDIAISGDHRLSKDIVGDHLVLTENLYDPRK